jgi:hypothetical protein
MNVKEKTDILLENGYTFERLVVDKKAIYEWRTSKRELVASESRNVASTNKAYAHFVRKNSMLVSVEDTYERAQKEAFEAQQEETAQAANDAAGEAAYNEAVEELRQQLADAQARIDAAVAIVEKGMLRPLSIEEVILLEGTLKPERHAHMEYVQPAPAEAPAPAAPKFKVGDKVRYIHARYNEGEYETVVSVGRDLTDFRYEVRYADGGISLVDFAERALEPYTDAPRFSCPDCGNSGMLRTGGICPCGAMA